MAQHNCEDLKLIDTPSTFSTFTHASSDYTSSQSCAHNPMATKCNESQYLTLLKHICAHNPPASQVGQANLSNSLTFPMSTRPWGACFEEICYRNRGAGFLSAMVQVHLPKFEAKDD